MNWKKLLESSAESANDELRLRNQYLVAENRILHNQIEGRLQLTDSDRKELAEIGAQLGKQALEEIATVAKANTSLSWNRKFANQKVPPCKPPKSVGRPRVDPEIEEWAVRMARENRSWGYDRIQGSLNHRGYTISDQTVGHVLKRHGIPPAPERKKTVTWGEFVRPHLDMLRATDFFNLEVWSWFGLMISYLLWVVDFGRRQVRFVGMVLQHLTQGWHPLVLGSHEVRTHAYRWVLLVKKRWQAMRLGVTIPEQTVFEEAVADARQLRSQDMSKELVVCVTHPKPIRARPLRNRQRFRGPPYGIYHEAA